MGGQTILMMGVGRQVWSATAIDALANPPRSIFHFAADSGSLLPLTCLKTVNFRAFCYSVVPGIRFYAYAFTWESGDIAGLAVEPQPFHFRTIVNKLLRSGLNRLIALYKPCKTSPVLIMAVAQCYRRYSSHRPA